MHVSGADVSLLVLGDAARVAPWAAELRACGFVVTIASTVSELRGLVADGLDATLVIVDARVDLPWRTDALHRMVALLPPGVIPALCVGQLLGSDLLADAHGLPADVALATLVETVQALQDGRRRYASPRAQSHPGLVDA